jgi:hypothetical protein
LEPATAPPVRRQRSRHQPPPQQNAAGIGGEAQLTFGNLAIAGGYTPYGFLISNWTARASWRPGKGPFTFSFNRDSVKDTQLSYAGLHDPYTATNFSPGTVWGGVMADAANIQYARGDLNSGFYVGAGGQYLTGLQRPLKPPLSTARLGAYWRIFTMPEYGTLNIGANFFGMHYTYQPARLSRWGHGRIFQPPGLLPRQCALYLDRPLPEPAGITPSWAASASRPSLSRTPKPFDPLDIGIETNTFLNAKLQPSPTSPASDRTSMSCARKLPTPFSDHWFVGGFAGANNSRNYTNRQRRLLRPLPLPLTTLHSRRPHRTLPNRRPAPTASVDCPLGNIAESDHSRVCPS